MKDTVTMTASSVGPGTPPKRWRDASGLSRGGTVEVHPLHDGKNSIIPTPKSPQRRGVSGKALRQQFSRCPWPMPPPTRHRLPPK